MTKDQKQALMVAGGIGAGILLLWLLSRNTQSTGPVGMDGPGPLTYNSAVPGYTTFNVTPPNIPLAPQPNVNTALMIGQGCCGADSVNDGCFTSDPLATGRGPLSLDQLLGWYGSTNPQFMSAWNAQLKSYGA